MPYFEYCIAFVKMIKVPSQFNVNDPIGVVVDVLASSRLRVIKEKNKECENQ